MKKYLLLLPVFLLIIFNLWDYKKTAAEKIFTYPESVKLDFYSSDNRLWHVYYLKKVYFEPVELSAKNRNDFNPPEEYFTGLFRMTYKDSLYLRIAESNPGLIYGHYLSPELFQKGTRIPFYYLQRFREYRNSFLLNLFYGKDFLLRALLNRKRAAANIYGVEAVSKIVYNRKFSDLNDEDKKKIMEFIFNESKRERLISADERSIFRDRLRGVLRRDVNKIQSGGNFRDYCISIIKNRGLLSEGLSLKVYTTIDLAFQKLMESLAKDYIIKLKGQNEIKRRILRSLDKIETAAFAIDTKTGKIRAMIGGTVYSGKNRFNRAIYSRRQISSAFKPFLYACVFENKGLKPETVFEDKPVFMRNRDGTLWKPGNFYPYYMGKVTLREGLVISINTIAVQLIRIAGVEAVAKKAREIFYMENNSIKKRIVPEPSLSLGSIDLTPLELAKGYLILASSGREKFPYPIIKVTDMKGDKILDYQKRTMSLSGRRIYSEKTVETVVDILKDVIKRGTAEEFIKKPFPFEVAGKSGSSPADSWFAGFSPELLILTWAGYDIPASSLKGKLPEFVVIPFWYHLMANHKPSKKKFNF